MLVSCGSNKQVTTESQPEKETNVNTEVDTTATVIPIEVTIDIPDQDDKIEMEGEKEIKTEPEVSETPEVMPKSFDHSEWNSLATTYVSATGNVNYEGFRKNRASLIKYIDALGQNVPDATWTKESTLAYWMNAYNAMTVDLILRNLPLASIKDIKNPWDQRHWKLGAKYYNLDEIEHQILRKMDDPRIHFGINCASFSCPPLLNEAFTAEKVDEQLDTLAKKFINDPKRNTLTSDSVEISKIFDWFKKDFKQNGSVIDYLNLYSEEQISASARIRYKDYDWTLNK